MVKTRQWKLAHKPRDDVQLEGSDQTFELIELDLPDLQDDEVQVKLLYLSNDPAQRAWIDGDADPHRLYVPPVNVGEPMRAQGLGEVVESKSSQYKKGDQVTAWASWSEYVNVHVSLCQPAVDLPKNLSKTHYLSTFGLTGLTAYWGLMDIGKPKADDIVVVSGAAGATGSMVVQIAKHVVGCKKVIGIAGGEKKCRWVVEKLGADQCLDYKSPTFAEDLLKATPAPHGFPNVYFDNVGGEILDLLLDRMARWGRVVACGGISSYNTAAERTTGLKNWMNVVIMRLTCRGFIVTDFQDRNAEALDVLRKALADGKLSIEDSETVVPTAFEDIPKTWLKLFDGSNQGKLITQLSS